MVRKLSLAIAVALGVSSFGANALGLGELRSKSALNEYFNAEIELLSLGNEEIEDIRVNLANAEAFRKAGIERPYYLSQLRFKPMRLPDGRGVIRVTSRDPVVEPFLDFLLEVNWPKGRLLREYTVLLDPPVTLARRPAPVSRPAAELARPAAPATTAGTGAAGGDGAAGEYGPTRRNDTLWGIASRLRPQGATQEQMMMALFQANPDAFIRRNINNLKVGQILRVPAREQILAMTPAQARQAFQEQVNEWRAARPAVAAGPQPATAQAAAQAPVAGATTAPAEPVPEAELKIATARPAGEGEAGPAESKDPTAVVAQLKQELLASEEARQSALEEGRELQSRVKDLEAQLADLQRLVTLQNNQLAQLQAALSETGDVEQEGMAAETTTTAEVMPEEGGGESAPLADTGEEGAAGTEQPGPGMEPVAAEEEGAAAGAGTEAAGVDQAAAEGESGETVTAAGEMTEESGTTTAAAGEEATPEMEAGTETVIAAAGAGADEEAGASGEEEVPATDEETVVVEEGETGATVGMESGDITEPAPAATDTAEPVTAEAEPTGTEAEAPVAAVPPKKPALLDRLMSDPNLMMGAAAGGGVLLLAIIWAAVSRRRRARDEEFQESILVNTMEEEGDETALASEGPASHPTEETSFLSDFSPSDIDALQEETGEVDPVAEADVYIAYGRYKQAEELIGQALEREPERTDLMLKLAEVLYATKDEEGFTRLAERASETGMPDKDPASWEKLVSMGSKIAPSSQLFAAGALAGGIAAGGAAATPEEQTGDTSAETTESLGDAFEGLDDLDNLDLGDLGELAGNGETKEPAEKAGEEEPLGGGLDFDLNLGTQTAPANEAGASRDPESEEEPEFDLASLEDTGTLSLDDLASELVESGEDSEAAAPPPQEEVEELESTVLDFSTEPATEAGQQEETLSLDGIELEPAQEETSGSGAETADATSDEVISLDELEVDETISELEGEVGEEEADEVNTKLDLARAYVDMGDSEGARSILDEVVEEGNETQQDEARKLMEALG